VKSEKGRLLYTQNNPTRKMRKKGLQPSEIKGRDERLSGALDFIHLLIKKQLLWLSGKARLFILGKFRRTQRNHRDSLDITYLK
jgi:hypothetical protein